LTGTFLDWYTHRLWIVPKYAIFAIRIVEKYAKIKFTMVEKYAIISMEDLKILCFMGNFKLQE